VSRAGSTIRTTPATDPKVLEPFIQPIVTSTQTSSTSTLSAASPVTTDPPAAMALVEPEDDASLVQPAPIIPTPGNRPPVVNAGREITLLLPQDNIWLDGSVSDDGVPGHALTSRWRDLNGKGALFSEPGDPRSFVSFPAAGTYVLELSASDGELESHADLIVRVLDPDAPHASLSQVAVRETHSARTTWIGFALSGSPADAVATLRIPIAHVVVPGTIEVNRVLDAWDARTLDGRYPPRADPAPVAIYDVQKDDAGLAVELDVTDAVAEWNSAAAERGFALVNTMGHVVIGGVKHTPEVEIRLN
jgi:hypothetical protein